MEKFDAIVIGSGIGGLTTASLLTQFYGKKVLVLEQHGKLGGFTHAFSRNKKWTWDAGLHYIGGMHEGSPLRKVMDAVTCGRVSWNKMKDPFQYFIYPNHKIPITSDWNETLATLGQLFPSEREGLQSWSQETRRANKSLRLMFMTKNLPKPLGFLVELFGRTKLELLKTKTSEVLARHIKSPELRAVLDSQWGDLGLPPSQSAFLMHAMLIQHYKSGGFYPQGGSKEIAAAIRAVLESKGSKVMTRTLVTEILVESGRAVGVKAKAGEEVLEFRAPLIFSNVGAYNTFNRFLPSVLSASDQKELRDLNQGCSALDLYVGLKGSASSLGIHGENYWIFDSYDHDDVWRRQGLALEGRPPAVFVSFGSANDGVSENHTAQIISFANYSDFKQWGEQKVKLRDDGYQKLKAKIAAGMIDLVDRHIPGFKELIEFHELGTPLTVEHYTRHPMGQIYGMPLSPARLRSRWMTAKTPVKGLYLTGADVMGAGVSGAMMGGLLATATACGWKNLRTVL